MNSRRRADKYRNRNVITVASGARIAVPKDGGFCPCSKIRYATKQAANRTLKRLALVDAEPKILTVYACPHLYGWHVGHDRCAVGAGR